MTTHIRINGERLWARHMEMARFGALPGGGCNRQALTDEDLAGREQFIAWCEGIGCRVRIDAIGNIFARLPGTDDSLAPVITGSHLDTQPSGGKFDGIYGVLGGLEALETLVDNGIQTRRPIEVVVWTNEEGCRFDTAMMGSAVWTGAMSQTEAYALTDREGRSVEQELKRIGHLGEVPATAGEVHAAIELHIEQGPVLEAEELEIGVVTGVQHMSRHRIFIHGEEVHAGPNPMALRKDPVMALGDFLTAMYEVANEHGPDSRVTFGFIDAQPGSSNTVPGRVELTVDIRHPQAEAYQSMLAAYEARLAAACARYGLEYENNCFWEAPGISFADKCVDAVRSATEGCGYSYRELVSGAGHDACNLAGLVPTSMIFVPCEKGISHNEAEYASPEQLSAGANVLLHTLMELAQG